MCVYLHFTLNYILPFLCAISRCSQCHPCARGLWGTIIPALGSRCSNSLFCTKPAASCRVTTSHELWVFSRWRQCLCGSELGILSKLSGCFCDFSPVDSTGCFAPCYCCMTFLLAQCLFLARDYHKYFSAGLSLPLNRESYYCKNFAETKKINWTNGKL